MAIRKPSHKATRRSTDASAVHPAWREIVALGESIPPEELEIWPRDGARNLDHYLYGAPKDDE